MKKNWSKPKLVILVKGTPDEVLQVVCRHPTLGSLGPTTQDNRCNMLDPKCRGCDNQGSKS